MLVEEIVGDGDHPGVPRAPLPALVAADQQDRGAARVESEQHANVTCGRDQFLHVLVSRLLDRVHERRPRLGPPRWRTFTAAVTASCSSSARLSHHSPNWSVYSTSQAIS